MVTRAMHHVRVPIVAGVLGAAVPNLASAQIHHDGTCTFAWEVSTDQGQSWRRGAVEIGEVTRTFQFRARVIWDNLDDYYVGAVFDGVWRGATGAGANDDVTGLGIADLTLYSSNIVGAVDMGDYLKFDYPSDFDPPGQGFGWYFATITHATFGMGGGSVVILEGTMHLDGSLGRRDFSQLFRVNPDRPQDIIGFHRVGGVTNYPAVTTPETSVIVIPAPGATGVLSLSGVALSRRRRR